MIVLGIESTAHTLGFAIFNNKKFLANERITFTTNEGGMVPAQVAEHHIKGFDILLKKTLEKSGIKLDKIELIAFSDSPGIGHCLRIGAGIAKSLSLLLNRPLIGVNHCIAHLEIGRLVTKAKDPVLLYCSGANTQIIAFEEGKYRVMGETLDVGVGNLLDNAARIFGLGFPGGPLIEKFALKGKRYIELPYSVKGMDVAFSGLITNIEQKIKSKTYSKEDLAYSLQETVFSMLIEVAERAMAHTGKKELLLGGGVACNKRLQEMAKVMCKERKSKCFIPAPEFLVDNAAMIALTGYLMYKAGERLSVEDAKIKPYERTDDVVVGWR